MISSYCHCSHNVKMTFTPFFGNLMFFQAQSLFSQIFWSLRNYSFALFLQHLFPSKSRSKVFLQLACREREAEQTPGTTAAHAIGSLDRGEIALVNRVTHGMSLLSFLLLPKAFISIVRITVVISTFFLTSPHSFWRGVEPCLLLYMNSRWSRWSTRCYIRFCPDSWFYLTFTALQKTTKRKKYFDLFSTSAFLPS